MNTPLNLKVMKLTDTISVNPGKETLGHIENPSTIFRSPVINSKTSKSSIELTKVLFPSYNLSSVEFKKYAVPLRTLFSTILIVTGISFLTNQIPLNEMGIAICSLCFGSLLACGLLTRLVMAGASIYYCIIGALLLRSGVIDMTAFTLMFGCLIFCVTGAGKYSCDTLIRKFIMRHRIQMEDKRKSDMMSYKAFHHVRF